MTAKLIELNDREGAYGMLCREIIVDHPNHGRLYLSEGYGGEREPDGGSYRWRHGIVAELLPGDTLELLRGAEWNEGTSYLQAVRHGADPARPLLEWKGYMVRTCAEYAMASLCEACAGGGDGPHHPDCPESADPLEGGRYLVG